MSGHFETIDYVSLLYIMQLLYTVK